jgi:hypothetical protein
VEVSAIRPEEYDRATEVWEASVRATHDFVSESDIIRGGALPASPSDLARGIVMISDYHDQ